MILTPIFNNEDGRFILVLKTGEENMQQVLRTFFWIAGGLTIIVSLAGVLGIPKGVSWSVLIGAITPGIITGIAFLWMGEVIGTLGEIANSLASKEGPETKPVQSVQESLSPEPVIVESSSSVDDTSSDCLRDGSLN